MSREEYACCIKARPATFQYSASLLHELTSAPPFSSWSLEFPLVFFPRPGVSSEDALTVRRFHPSYSPTNRETTMTGDHHLSFMIDLAAALPQKKARFFFLWRLGMLDIPDAAAATTRLFASISYFPARKPHGFGGRVYLAASISFSSNARNNLFSRSIGNSRAGYICY